MNIDNVSILSKTDHSESKVSTKPFINVVNAVFLGLIIIFVIIFFQEILDKRIITGEAVEELLNLPVLVIMRNLVNKGGKIMEKNKNIKPHIAGDKLKLAICEKIGVIYTNNIFSIVDSNVRNCNENLQLFIDKVKNIKGSLTVETKVLRCVNEGLL